MRCFLLVKGQKHGPYELEQVREFLAQGHITPETLVWPEGATGWMPLRQLRGAMTGHPAAPELIAAPPPLQAAELRPGPRSDISTAHASAREAPRLLLQLIGKWKIPLVLVALTLLAWWWTTDFPIHVGASPRAGRTALILMHGHGAPADDLVPLAEELSKAAPEVCFIVPPGTHGAGLRGRAWWPSVRAKSKQEFERVMAEELRETREQVLDLVRDLEDDGVAPAKIIVGGFSAGAIVALDVVLAEGEGRELGGLVFLSGDLRFQKLERLEGRAPLRVFAAHGTADPVIPGTDARKLVAALEERRHDVTWVEHAGTHRVHDEAVAALGEFLASF